MRLCWGRLMPWLNTSMEHSPRSELFLVLFYHRKRGPLAGHLLVSLEPSGWWQTEWDIGTIDKESKLSDEWFFRGLYQEKFIQVIQIAANKSKSPHFEVPAATSRWGVA